MENSATLFPVILRITVVHGKEEGFPEERRAQSHFRAWRKVELPFPPFGGLVLWFEKQARAKVKSVSWLVPESRFECVCEDEFVPSNGEHGIGDFNAVADIYREEGWEVSRVCDT